LFRHTKLVLGSAKQRLQASNSLRQALQLLKETEASREMLQFQVKLKQYTTCHLDCMQAADIMVCIVQRYVCFLARKAHTCFLMQELFRASSVSSKWRIVASVFEQLDSVICHERGNYLVTMVLDFLRWDLHTDAQKQNQWHEFHQYFVSVHVATDKFGSFVLKHFVEWSSAHVKSALARKLWQSGCQEALVQNCHGQFVVKKLVGFLA